MKKLMKVPQKTGLELVCDGRSGAALEIVIPVFNEEKRIGVILDYYKDFDVVLLDGGSFDRTLEMAAQRGATVYRRQGEAIGENHFTFYTNTLSKSGCCFYMMADEYLDNRELKEGYAHLRRENTVVGVRKIEWIYGEAPAIKRDPNLGMARGFRAGTAAYDPYNIHDSLLCVNDADAPLDMVVYDLHHLHIKVVQNEYGKMGRYLDIEVGQMRQSGASFGGYLRRFVVPILAQILWRVWFNKTPLPHKIFKIVELTTATLLALLCWLEMKFMPSAEKQLKEYTSKYS